MTRSALQSETSRANGSLSNGPVSAEGKLTSSRNSTKHDLTSKTLLLPGESEEDYKELLQNCLNQFHPHTPQVVKLATELAEAHWRLERSKKIEVQMLSKLMDQHTSPDLPVYERLAEVHLLPKKEIAPYHTIIRYQAMYLREIVRLHKELRLIAVSLPVEYEELRNEPEPQAAHHDQTPRNAPCPCGSGEKYKRCCGKNAPPELTAAA